MSNMNGNDDYQDAVGYSAEASLIQQETEPERAILATQANTWATLALAYEQRTANLIAIHSRGSIDLTDFSEKHRDDWIQMARDIGARLGISQEDTK